MTTTTKKRAQCWSEFCCNPATFHIGSDDVGVCDQHHNLGYVNGFHYNYRKPEDCHSCVKEGLVTK